MKAKLLACLAVSCWLGVLPGRAAYAGFFNGQANYFASTAAAIQSIITNNFTNNVYFTNTVGTSWKSTGTNIAPTNLTDFTLPINPTNSTWINLYLTNQLPQPVTCALAFPTLVSTSAVPLRLNLTATDTLLYTTNMYLTGGQCANTTYFDSGGLHQGGIVFTPNSSWAGGAGGAYTVSFWFCADNLTYQGADQGGPFDMSVCIFTSADWMFASYGGQLNIYDGASSYWVSYSATLDTIHWVHCAVVYDGVSTLSFYINGVDVWDNTSYTPTAIYSHPLMASQRFGWGSDFPAQQFIAQNGQGWFGGSDLQGRFDQVQYLTTALSGAQVAALYNSGLGVWNDLATAPFDSTYSLYQFDADISDATANSYATFSNGGQSFNYLSSPGYVAIQPGQETTNYNIFVSGTNSYNLAFPGGTAQPDATHRIMYWGQGGWQSSSTDGKVTP